MSKHYIDTVEKYLSALSNQTRTAIPEIFAPNATVEDPVGTPAHEGIDAIVAFYEGAFSAGVTGELTGQVRVAGKSAAFPFIVKVGPSMQINVIDIFEFNDEGKVVSMKAYWGPENIQNL